MYNVKDYGALGDGKNLDSKNIQKAIDACAENGGGTVFIPAGKYLCGTMHLKSHTHIFVEKGAFLLGSKDVTDFDPREANPSNNLYQDESHSYFHHSLFHADGVCDIAITGFGTIDMQTVREADSEGKRSCKIIALKNCTDVTIKDLTMLNACDLAVYFAGCENVIVSGLKMKVFIDGISPDSCKNVVISDCIIDAEDDAIVAKSSYTLGYPKPMENLVISNCVLRSLCSAIKFGTESNTGFLNVTITGCTIYNTCLSGIAIEAVDGALVDGFSISNITMCNVVNPLLIMVLDRASGPEGTTIGEIKNISISNMTIKGPYDLETRCQGHSIWWYKGTYPMIIYGQENSIIKNISLSNIQFSAEGGGTVEDREIVVPNLTDGYPDCYRFGEKLQVYGLVAKYVDNLKLYNVDFYTESEDAREAIYLEEVTRYKNV